MIDASRYVPSSPPLSAKGRRDRLSLYIEQWDLPKEESRNTPYRSRIANYNVLVPMFCEHYSAFSRSNKTGGRYDIITAGLRAYASSDAWEANFGESSHLLPDVLDATPIEVLFALASQQHFAIVVTKHRSYLWRTDALSTYGSAAKIARVLYAAGAYPQDIHVTLIIDADKWCREAKEDLEELGGVLLYDDTGKVTRRKTVPEGSERVEYMGRNYARYIRVEGEFSRLKRFQAELLDEALMRELNRRLKKRRMGVSGLPSFEGFAALYPLVTGRDFPEEQLEILKVPHSELCRGCFLEWDSIVHILEEDAHVSNFYANKRTVSKHSDEIDLFCDMLDFWEHLLVKKSESGAVNRRAAMAAMADILSGRVAPESDKGRMLLEKLQTVSENDGTNWAVDAAAAGVPVEYISTPGKN